MERKNFYNLDFLIFKKFKTRLPKKKQLLFSNFITTDQCGRHRNQLPFVVCEELNYTKFENIVVRAPSPPTFRVQVQTGFLVFLVVQWSILSPLNPIRFLWDSNLGSTVANFTEFEPPDDFQTSDAHHHLYALHCYLA